MALTSSSSLNGLSTAGVPPVAEAPLAGRTLELGPLDCLFTAFARAIPTA